MTEYVILECPKCHKTQQVSLRAFNHWIRYRGHPYTCGDCRWDVNETPDFNDYHVNLEVAGIYTELLN